MREKKRENFHALSEYIQNTLRKQRKSSDNINLESADFLEICSQKLNDMVISVFEQSTTITV